MAKLKSGPKPLEFILSFETANALQAIITQQHTHAKRENNATLLKELDQIDRFYIRLTEYIESSI